MLHLVYQVNLKNNSKLRNTKYPCLSKTSLRTPLKLNVKVKTYQL